MTLQWTILAGVVWTEMTLVALLVLLPIRPTIWKKLFNSRLVHFVEKHARVYAGIFVAIILLLLVDAIRDVRHYSDAPDIDPLSHMRLFRAERNLFISFFSLFLGGVIYGLTALIRREAHLLASIEASLNQARAAANAAEMMLIDDANDESDDDSTQPTLVALKKKIAQLREELESVKEDRDAMKQRAMELRDDYNHLALRLDDLPPAEIADELTTTHLRSGGRRE